MNNTVAIGKQVRIKWTEPATAFCGHIGKVEGSDTLEDGEWFYVAIHRQRVAFRACELEVLS